MEGAASFQTKYSLQSVAASRLRPGKMLKSSEEVGWRSMLLQTFEQSTTVDDYETKASPDGLLVFVLSGAYDLECLSSGVWRKAAYRPGVGGFTASLTTNRLRWRSQKDTLARIARLYVPQQCFDEAAEASRQVGTSRLRVVPDTLSLSDSVVFSVVKAALTAMDWGEPDLYADSCSRFLATHLVCSFDRRTDAGLMLHPTDLTDRRLRRVLEFMQYKFAHDLSLDELAREAGISPFHFSRIFKEKVGATPHQHLRRLRLNHASHLLQETDMSVSQIAQACGYLHEGHFAAAFRKFCGFCPSAFRKTC